MAYKPPKPPKPVTLTKWLGINEAAGETEINFGEAVYQRNFRVTKNYKPQKREGWMTFDDQSTSSPNNVAWIGTINSKEVLIYESGGRRI